jgi:5'-nucleotidase
MNILLTNDDGWGFEGLTALEIVARQFGEIWTVAPEKPMSGISHQLTFERPMRFSQKQDRSFALDGTPADCVRVAMTQLDVPFDWVLSGVNKGANLGSDTCVSGTVAAAREASLFGCKAIALSQHLRKFKQPFDWSKTIRMAEKVLPQIMDRSIPQRSWVNVNFPDIESDACSTVKLVETQLDPAPLPAQYTKTADGKLLYCGVYNDRPRKPNHDADVCFSGGISVTYHD